MDRYRRSLLFSSAAFASAVLAGRVMSQQAPAGDDAAKREFIERANRQWSEARKAIADAIKGSKQDAHLASLKPARHLVPFKDWDYYYLAGSTSEWEPNPGQRHKRVVVPVGFVTDLASVPTIGWSSGIRPEGSYAYAAIVHDYLYWTQERSRDETDDIFLYAMEDSKVDKTLRNSMYQTVKKFGGAAWKNNAKLKKAGERRVLKRFPDDFTTRWAEWKKQPGVFDD